MPRSGRASVRAFAHHLLERVYLARCKLPGHSGLEAFQRQRPDRPANEPSQTDSDRSRHVPDLSFFPFAQDNAQPYAFLRGRGFPSVRSRGAKSLNAFVKNQPSRQFVCNFDAGRSGSTAFQFNTFPQVDKRIC